MREKIFPSWLQLHKNIAVSLDHRPSSERPCKITASQLTPEILATWEADQKDHSVKPAPGK
jgi:hypothetical protein